MESRPRIPESLPRILGKPRMMGSHLERVQVKVRKEKCLKSLKVTESSLRMRLHWMVQIR